MSRSGSNKRRNGRNSNRKSSTRRRRSKARNAAQFVRGLILEGAGVAVLVFLYVTIQATSDTPLVGGQQPSVETELSENEVRGGLSGTQSVAQNENRQATFDSPMTRRPATRSWAEYNRNTMAQFNSQATLTQPRRDGRRRW